MKSFFRELFEFSHDVNLRLGELLVVNREGTSEKSVKLFNHILNAHQIWNSRIEPNQLPFGVWDDHLMEEYQVLENGNYGNSLMILGKYDLEEQINYSRRGMAFTNSVRDIFFHIINHSTYHRGQIAAELRQNGIEPLATDYILYKR